ncbi:MAG: CHAP domain-containing protein, partial [Eggerthellaceae bacterium]|nr:CHAP domain-containing protein [Eggerthellaceae bacterium]
MSNTAESVLAIARGELGYSRWSDPEAGTKYGRWYEKSIDRCSTNYDFGGNGVPYCAMFASWCFNQAEASCVGLPGAYCPSIVHIGRSRGKTVATRSAKPGDVVLFDWEGDGTSDHVG